MPTYSYDEAYKESLDYFNGKELAAKIFVDKYALRSLGGDILEKSPHDMHVRIATHLARIEAKKFKEPLSFDTIFGYLDKFKKIIPQGSILAGLGSEAYVTLSNCYVINPPEDSIGGINYTDEQISQISKRRGGIGFRLDNLRPAGLPTANSSRTTSGIIPFCEKFSDTIRTIGQGGRRGASMQMLSVHHPQVLDFARAKLEEGKITGANMSIALSDEFLSAVENDIDYEQRWPVNSKTPTVSKMVNARSVWKEIIKCAWKRAEPGLLFWDNIIRESPADCYASLGFETNAVNPCSELSLSILDSCRLLLLNLISYVRNPFTPQTSFDYYSFYQDVQIAQRLLDDIIDLELECLDRIIDKIQRDPESEYIKRNELDTYKKVRETCFNGRRTGLGITALGDTLAALGLKYGSDDSIKMVDKIYQILKFGSYRSSVDMAKEIGPFPIWNWELEKDNPFLKRIQTESIWLGADGVFESMQLSCWDKLGKWGSDLYKDMAKYGRRNIANLTTSPAGTVSEEAWVGSVTLKTVKPDSLPLTILPVTGDLFGTTSGIEPAFMLEYTRRKKITHNDKNSRVDFTDLNGDKWQEFSVFHPGFEVWKANQPFPHETDKNKLIEESPWFNACAEDIDWVQRVKLQAAAQKHVDHSISSTINLPNDVTEEKVAEIYEAAWKAGLKGITVYRKGCRDGVLIDNKTTKDVKRPKSLECSVHHIKVKGKEYFVLVGLKDNVPYEVFAGRNGFLNKKIKKGTITKVRNQYKAEFEDGTELVPITAASDEFEEAITRLTSVSLRAGASIEAIVDQLEKVNGDMTSFAKSVARALKTYIKDGETDEVCEECLSGKIVRQEGCKKCVSCGWSKCS